jgi:hypothetical protein
MSILLLVWLDSGTAPPTRLQNVSLRSEKDSLTNLFEMFPGQRRDATAFSGL